MVLSRSEHRLVFTGSLELANLFLLFLLQRTRLGKATFLACVHIGVFICRELLLTIGTPLLLGKLLRGLVSILTVLEYLQLGIGLLALLLLRQNFLDAQVLPHYILLSINFC